MSRTEPASAWASTGFLISTDLTLLQIDRIHNFLSRSAYWCLEIPRETVAKAAQNSLCFGLYDTTRSPMLQVGYARIVTDYATFAWLCDVYIEIEYRGRGLSKWLTKCVLEAPHLKGLRRICLATKDAHSLYEKYDFEITKTPGNWMEIKDNELYKRLKLQLDSSNLDVP